MPDRRSAAEEIARSGGHLALDYFRKLDTLAVEEKGAQDFVTIADRAVEEHIRDLITTRFPDDGILGEEHAPKPSQSGYTWVIDPIDGTANFINAIPVWCVVIAVVADDKTQISTTYDPVHDEMFAAARGEGATLNGASLTCPADTQISRGTVAVGLSGRSDINDTLALMRAIL
ncbi:MAG: inositol monophosphatase, partial [Pseudomonadota bacterium]